MQVAFILNVDIVVASFNSTVLKPQQMLKYSLANCFRIESIFEPESANHEEVRSILAVDLLPD